MYTMLPLCMPRGLSTTLNLPGWYNIITAWGFLKKSAFWVVQLYRKVVLCDWKLHNTIRTKKWWPYNRVFNIIDRSNMGGEKMHRESVQMYFVCVQCLTWLSCRRISENPKHPITFRFLSSNTDPLHTINTHNARRILLSDLQGEMLNA